MKHRYGILVLEILMRKLYEILNCKYMKYLSPISHEPNQRSLEKYANYLLNTAELFEITIRPVFEE